MSLTFGKVYLYLIISFINQIIKGIIRIMTKMQRLEENSANIIKIMNSGTGTVFLIVIILEYSLRKVSQKYYKSI